MELMSILLFCAFVARFPQALGVHSDSDSNIRAKLNGSNLNVFSSVISGAERRDLNSSVTHKVNESTELYPYLSDDPCYECTTCVEKALEFHQNYKFPFENHHQAMASEGVKHSVKTKRSAHFDFNNAGKVQDSVKVTKFKNADDKVYAIKVNKISDPILESNYGKSTCKVYSVKKAYPCESEESNFFLMKRKISKRKTSKQKHITAYKEKPIPKVTKPEFKKSKALEENTHVPESFMPSIEELY